MYQNGKYYTGSKEWVFSKPPIPTVKLLMPIPKNRRSKYTGTYCGVACRRCYSKNNYRKSVKHKHNEQDDEDEETISPKKQKLDNNLTNEDEESNLQTEADPLFNVQHIEQQLIDKGILPTFKRLKPTSSIENNTIQGELDEFF